MSGVEIVLSAQVAMEGGKQVVLPPHRPGKAAQNLGQEQRITAAAGKKEQPILCAGHRHIEQPPLLVIKPFLLLGFWRLGITGQNAVNDIQQVHRIVFQSLAGMNGGQQQLWLLMLLWPGNRLMQPVQVFQKSRKAGLALGQQRQNGKFISVQAIVLRIFAIAHSVPDSFQTHFRVILPQHREHRG